MENWEEFLIKNRYPALIILLGLTLTAFGVLFFKTGFNFSGEKVEILSGENSANTAGQPGGELTAEIGGSVEKPGVYKLAVGSRIDDLLVSSGGFTADADRNYTDKYLNRAAKLADGQKVYIPKAGEQTLGASGSKQTLGTSDKSGGGDQTVSSNFSSDSQGLININTASTSQLESLPGIGPVYAQNIIEHRPYSTTQELVSKGAIKQNLYDKIKDGLTVY